MTNSQIQKIIDYTNSRLKSWYKDAFIDYQIKGTARASYNVEHDSLQINYIENGQKASFETFYFKYEAIDYAFNVWMEDADVEADAIK
jgi:hypothetical protein